MRFQTIIIISLLSVFFYSEGFAQSNSDKRTVEGEFWAAGVCGMCKNRIETALDVPGVKFAIWEKDSQLVRVVYRQDKVSLESLMEKVAKVGHQTKTIQKDDKAYADLPRCCQYEDGAAKH